MEKTNAVFYREIFQRGEYFFALYPTDNGPIMYYEGKEYPLKKDLHIYLTKTEKSREFLDRRI